MSNFRIKVFYLVAVHQSFTKAAEELLISQPAVTKNIKELETQLGIRLFTRDSGKVILSEAGKIVLNYAENILKADRKLQFDLSQYKEKYEGQLNLGASTTIGQYLLPSVLAQFHLKYPEIQLSLINDNTRNIEKALVDNRIELGVVEGSYRNSKLKYVPLLEDEIVAIVHTSQPLASKDEITIEELKSVPLVLREVGSGSLDIICEALKKADVKLQDLNIIMHLGSTESIKSFLSASDAMGLVSISAVSRELARGEFKIVDIKDFEILRTFYFVYPHGGISGFADIFMQYIAHYYNQRL